MARSGMLTTRRVDELARAKVPGHWGDGGGLTLQISKWGTPSWTFRFRIAGKLREAGIGSLDTLTLEKARTRARQMREQRLDDIDPIEAKRSRRHAAQLASIKVMSFMECGDAYIKAHKAAWGNAKHAAQWATTLETYVYPVLGALDVAHVDTALVTRMLATIWTSKPETASRVRGRVESILGWATTNGYRSGDNPARWQKHLENLLAEPGKIKTVKHLTALPYADLPTFMVELRGQDGVAARALEFAILVAARTGEVINARWAEFDLANKMWVVPGDRMKAGREHRVPLSDAALDTLTTMATIRDGEFVFPGTRAGRPLGEGALLVALKRVGRGDLTVHGFRSTFSDWCTEQTAFPAEARELALAHAIGNKVEAAYRRGDRFDVRRRLAAAWAKFCTTLPGAGDNVVELRA
jgi:integrase